jgi:putative endonuclease
VNFLSFGQSTRAPLKPIMNKRDRGLRGEDRALAFLLEKGYTVIERNYRTARGEIDIIARDGDRIVFVEVKVVGVYPAEDLGRIVGPVKQRRIRTTGERYVYEHPEWSGRAARCDVIMVVPGENGIVHLENAF